jgi:hypothetical protein
MPNVAQTFVRDEGARDAQARSFRLELTRWQQLLLTVDSTFATQKVASNTATEASARISSHDTGKIVPSDGSLGVQRQTFFAKRSRSVERLAGSRRASGRPTLGHFGRSGESTL